MQLLFQRPILVLPHRTFPPTAVERDLASLSLFNVIVADVHQNLLLLRHRRNFFYCDGAVLFFCRCRACRQVSAHFGDCAGVCEQAPVDVKASNPRNCSRDAVTRLRESPDDKSGVERKESSGLEARPDSLRVERTVKSDMELEQEGVELCGPLPFAGQAADAAELLLQPRIDKFVKRLQEVGGVSGKADDVDPAGCAPLPQVRGHPTCMTIEEDQRAGQLGQSVRTFRGQGVQKSGEREGARAVNVGRRGERDRDANGSGGGQLAGGGDNDRGGERYRYTSGSG
jgi:hypothetical protein